MSESSNWESQKCVILKNPESHTVASQLIEIERRYLEDHPEWTEQVVTSAFKLYSNNFAEKPIYDRSSDEVSFNNKYYLRTKVQYEGLRE